MLSQFKIGHYTDLKNGTGCTVIVPPENNVCSAVALGASPGTREFALLQPDKKIQSINALLLTGGSAYGLNAATGIMHSLESRGIGYQTNFGVVPIVPGAVIFDLNVGNGKVRPGPEEGIKALDDARFNNNDCGCIGAGTGATVGKWSGLDNAMKGGLGVARIEHGDLKACAVVVLNSVGDITDKNGNLIAGAYKDNHFLAEQNNRLRWGQPVAGLAENTILTAVLINAGCSKQTAHYLAHRAHLGIAQRVVPSHTSYDGDVAFVVSTNTIAAPVDTVSSMIVEVVQNAILAAVINAETLFNIPSVKSIK